MDKQVLNKYKNKVTAEVKIIWETKQQYENHKPEFDINFIQIG